MRPCRSTWVASTITSPAPQLDSMPRCAMCQSVMLPSSALYWHIGETTMRLGSSIGPSFSGANRDDMEDPSINNYFKPPAPQPEAATAANAELVQVMREQQALLSEYLKKSAEAHQRADQAVALETDKLKAAERDAIQALREAKAAELRALAAA